MLLGDNLHWQMREVWIYTDGVYTRYPFQGALYGLPTDTIKECILGAIEAKYSNAAQEPPENFERFIYQVWGAGIAGILLSPITRSYGLCRALKWRPPTP